MATDPTTDRAPDRIARLIQEHGPITFSRFMEEALYGAGGFYEEAPVGSGAGTSFVTSPHVHPVFGQLLGTAIAELWDLLGRPEPFRLAEVGAGDGTLAHQLIDGLSHLGGLRYIAVERSAGSREKLASSSAIEVTDEIPRAADLFLANELLDNLPFDLRIDGTDVMIAVRSDGGFEPLVEGRRVDGLDRAEVVPLGAIGFIDRLAGSLRERPSYSLLIDYGGSGAAGGPAHGYRSHSIVEDLLDEPGSSDITAGIDFDLIVERAVRAGLATHGPIEQRQALIALGFDRWVGEELERQQRLLDERDGIEAVRAWGGRSRATLLVDPLGLGRLRWLLLSTEGLPAPSWLSGQAT
jgi:NADH dehydrogenase [ubiquinone] 1 alpha subcomplex assembly factor 7